MTPNFAGKSEKDLKTFVDNYRRSGQTSSDTYRSLLRELELKRGKGLDLEKTLACVITAAKENRFVSYKQVAEASDLPFANARLRMTVHLRELCAYAQSRRLPLLSAIIVNTDGLATGTMNAQAQAGFLKAAESLGADTHEGHAFISAEQKKIFELFAAGEIA